MTKKVEPTKARQGRSGTRVLTVLLAALILAMIVWWGVGMFGETIEPNDQVGGAPAEQPAGTQDTPVTPAD